MFSVFSPEYSTDPDAPPHLPAPKSDSIPCVPLAPSESRIPIRRAHSKRVYHFVEYGKRKDRDVRSQVNTQVMRDFVHRTKGRVLHHPKRLPSHLECAEQGQKNEKRVQRIGSARSLGEDSSSDTPPVYRNPRVARLSSNSSKDTDKEPQEKGKARHCRSRKSRTKDDPKPSPQDVYAALEEYLRKPAIPPGSTTDPFLTLPEKFTKWEHMILQHYLDVLPERLYGIRKDAALNPNRYFLFPLAQSDRYAAVIQWCLISAAYHYRAQGGQIDDSYIIRRRRKAYRLIHEGLSDPKRCLSDDVMLCILAAVWVETRYGHPQAARLNVQGFCSMMKRRGGIASMTAKPWHWGIFQGLHLAGTGVNVSSIEDLEEVHEQTNSLIEKLWSIQQGQVELRHWQSSLCHEENQLVATSGTEKTLAPRDSSVDPSPASPPIFPALAYYLHALTSATRAPTDPAPSPSTTTLFPEFFRTPSPLSARPHENESQNSLRSRYLLCREASFSLFSPLGWVLTSFHRIATTAPSTRQHLFLACLLSLNLALWEYRQDLEASIYYLETLVRNFKINSFFDYKTERTIASIETLNWFLVVGGLDLRGKGGAWMQNELDRKWEVTNAMKVLRRVGSEKMERVQEALYGFLIYERRDGRGDNDKHSSEASLLDDRLLDDIKSEILAGLRD